VRLSAAAPALAAGCLRDFRSSGRLCRDGRRRGELRQARGQDRDHRTRRRWPTSTTRAARSSAGAAAAQRHPWRVSMTFAQGCAQEPAETEQGDDDTREAEARGYVAIVALPEHAWHDGDQACEQGEASEAGEDHAPDAHSTGREVAPREHARGVEALYGQGDDILPGARQSEAIAPRCEPQSALAPADVRAAFDGPEPDPVHGRMGPERHVEFVVLVRKRHGRGGHDQGPGTDEDEGMGRGRAEPFRRFRPSSRLGEEPRRSAHRARDDDEEQPEGGSRARAHHDDSDLEARLARSGRGEVGTKRMR